MSTPIFVQQRILTGWEYRIIGFREKSFFYRVKQPVQSRLESRPDERIILAHPIDGKSLVPVMYDYVEEIEEVSLMIRKFLHEANLQYGAFDIIIGDEGDVYFLECNPEGQWGASAGANDKELISYFGAVLINEFNNRVQDMIMRKAV